MGCCASDRRGSGAIPWDYINIWEKDKPISEKYLIQLFNEATGGDDWEMHADEKGYKVWKNPKGTPLLKDVLAVKAEFVFDPLITRDTLVKTLQNFEARKKWDSALDECNDLFRSSKKYLQTPYFLYKGPINFKNRELFLKRYTFKDGNVTYTYQSSLPKQLAKPKEDTEISEMVMGFHKLETTAEGAVKLTVILQCQDSMLTEYPLYIDTTMTSRAGTWFQEISDFMLNKGK